MKFKYFLLILMIPMCLSNIDIYAQSITNPSLREELLNRKKADQDIRMEVSRKVPNGGEIPKADAERWHQLDNDNTTRMKELIRKYGWLGKSIVGEDGAAAAFLLIQHADKDLEFQKQCLKLMKKAVKRGEAPGKHLAYLTDRVLVAEGKPQIYGTQMKFTNDKFGPAPIKDEKNVDKRRKSVGLEPLAEYVKKMKAL